MQRITPQKCEECGGTYHALEDGTRYPIYSAPVPCSCGSEDDVNTVAARVVREATTRSRGSK